jgi:putative GTP pyrophosphokinase
MSRPKAPPRPRKYELDRLIEAYVDRKDEFDYFRRQVTDFFLISKRFNSAPLPLVHSVKSRLKEVDHLREKLIRKWIEGPITTDTLFSRMTDLAGVRVIHLYSKQFEAIHSAIVDHIQQGYWYLSEAPVAYSWDPEATAYFTRLGVNAQTRDSYYTSIHYVVKPQPGAALTCEIQVRTLFEEAWGEIDHALNYPKSTESLACREQIRVLAKLASTGTRLADSIFATAKEAGFQFAAEG